MKFFLIIFEKKKASSYKPRTDFFSFLLTVVNFYLKSQYFNLQITKLIKVRKN